MSWHGLGGGAHAPQSSPEPELIDFDPKHLPEAKVYRMVHGDLQAGIVIAYDMFGDYYRVHPVMVDVEQISVLPAVYTPNFFEVVGENEEHWGVRETLPWPEGQVSLTAED